MTANSVPVSPSLSFHNGTPRLVAGFGIMFRLEDSAPGIARISMLGIPSRLAYPQHRATL